MSLAAASFALIFQAEARGDTLSGIEGVAVDYSRVEVIKDSGVFYGWLLLAALGAARLLIVWGRRCRSGSFS